MKKLKLTIAALAIAAGAFATYSFTPTNEDSKTTNNLYYWYDMSGELLNETPSAEPDSDCGTTGAGCSIGFTNKPVDPLIAVPDQERGHE